MQNEIINILKKEEKFSDETVEEIRKVGINDFADMDKLLSMYRKYHEMDIMQFVDCMDLMSEENRESALKRLRMYAGLSQKELAIKADIPLRTIQQYEQGQKDLSHARADSVIRLSKALYCDVEDLI